MNIFNFGVIFLLLLWKKLKFPFENVVVKLDNSAIHNLSFIFNAVIIAIGTKIKLLLSIADALFMSTFKSL